MTKQSPNGGNHIYVGRTPGLAAWSTDYELIAEWAGGEENVSIMHTRAHGYVLDMASDPDVIDAQECCMNRRYDCGHLAYGPPKRLPADCPECKPVATDGGKSPKETEHVEWEAVCHEDGCRGIDHGPYSHPKYARSDKNAHEEWHEQRGETADVEVVKRSVDTETEQ